MQECQIQIWIWAVSPWPDLATADDKRAQGHTGADWDGWKPRRPPVPLTGGSGPARKICKKGCFYSAVRGIEPGPRLRATECTATRLVAQM